MALSKCHLYINKLLQQNQLNMILPGLKLTRLARDSGLSDTAVSVTGVTVNIFSFKFFFKCFQKKCFSLALDL